MKVANKVPLDELSYVEISPVIWEPTTGGERLAALLAYLTGDGNVTRRSAKHIQASFYTNVEQDACLIQEALFELGGLS